MTIVECNKTTCIFNDRKKKICKSKKIELLHGEKVLHGRSTCLTERWE